MRNAVRARVLKKIENDSIVLKKNNDNHIVNPDKKRKKNNENA